MKDRVGKKESEDRGPEDKLGFWRGFLIAILISSACWVLIGWVVWRVWR